MLRSIAQSVLLNSVGGTATALHLVRALATSPKRYDAVVVGLGAHGSAALYSLAKQGAKVLGIDRFNSISNERSSHHGQTRITRMAYMEGPEYVPLLRKSFELYKQLESETGQKLYWQTGCLNIGDPVFSAARATAEHYHLPHEALTAQQAEQRWPGLKLPANTPVLYEEVGGIVEPEKMIQAHILRAWYYGAHVRTGEKCIGWEADGEDGPVRVTTDYTTYEANKLIITGGAWIDQLVPELKGLCVPGRVSVAWFQSQQHDLYHHSRFPVWILHDSEQNVPFYGFPEFGKQAGVKLGKFSVGAEECNPDNLQREQRPEDIEPLQAALQRHMPQAAGDLLHFSTCMFTMTPDGHFVIDHHPRHRQVILCSACSGHGFKLSPAIGSILADMVLKGSCTEFAEQLHIHKLDRKRQGHAAVLDRFQQ